MKQKLLILFALLLIGISSKVQAISFSSICSSGQTLYYNTTSTNTVEVTFGSTKPTGILTIPNSVTYGGNSYLVASIGQYAFQFCTNLISVTIPNSVTSISSCAFIESTSLASINVASNNLRYSSNSGVLFSKNQDTLFCCPNGKSGSYVIPNSVTSIGEGACQGCSGLTSITIPSSVTSIGSYAFCYCTGLTSITIPNSVISIGYGAYYKCSSLTSVSIPNSVTLIQSGAFSLCNNLISFNLSSSVLLIGDTNFVGCNSLTTINVDTSNAKYCSLNGALFNKNKDTLICVPAGKDSSFEIPSSTIFICDLAFYFCSGLSSIKCNSFTPPVVDGINTFCGVSNSIPIYVPCVSIYNSSQYWSFFYNFIGENETYLMEYKDTICKGSAYNKYGFNFIVDTAGLYTQHLQSIRGCDSIIKLELNFLNPTKQDIDMVTVDNSNHNVVVWDKKEFVNHYNIYREGVVMGQFDLIGTVPYDSLGIYTDTNSNPTVKAYMYKVSATDTCMNESELSTSHKTMHLTIGQGMGNNWNLNWTPYEGANYSTNNIYRGINSLDSLKYLTTISASNTSYTDINVPSGYVYYQVEILKDTTTSNKSKVINSIRSNFATNKVVSLTKMSNNEDNIKLYPNPTSNKAILEIEGINEGADIVIYDLSGRVVGKYRLSPKQKQFEINVEGLARGVYNINIKNDKCSLTKKLIVE